MSVNSTLHPVSIVQHSLAARLRRIRLLLVLMMVGLVISGLTAIPLRWGIEVLVGIIGPGTWMQSFWPAMAAWLGTVYDAILFADTRYPLLFYGTDWLAFAHVVIAIAFIGPLRDPVRNIWVIEFGMIACILIIPTALLFGPLRGIPFFWQLIDCSFGVFGLIPLWFARREIIALERAQTIV